MFLKSASFVSFTDKNFKCLTEIKILSVRMSNTKIQNILHRTRTCLTENYPVWHDVSFCQTQCLTSLKRFQEVCFNICPNILYADADADADAGGIAIALLHLSAVPGALKMWNTRGASKSKGSQTEIWLVGCIEDLCPFSGISAISRLGSGR